MKESEVVWALAQIGPATVNEIESFMEDKTNCASASTTVTRVWRHGLLVRKKITDNGQGGQPYKYALAMEEQV